MKRNREHYYKYSRNPIVLFFKYTGTVRIFADGDGVSILWHWWHPITWIIVGPVFFVMCAFDGEPYVQAAKDALFFTPFWQKRRDEIEWL